MPCLELELDFVRGSLPASASTLAPGAAHPCGKCGGLLSFMHEGRSNKHTVKADSTIYFIVIHGVNQKNGPCKLVCACVCVYKAFPCP